MPRNRHKPLKWQALSRAVVRGGVLNRRRAVRLAGGTKTWCAGQDKLAARPFPGHRLHPLAPRPGHPHPDRPGAGVEAMSAPVAGTPDHGEVRIPRPTQNGTWNVFNVLNLLDVLDELP